MNVISSTKSLKVQSGLFKILAHPVRLAILEILRGGEQCVCHLEASLDLRQAYISQHLMLLREAGLVMDRREGWNIYYRVTRMEIYDVLDSIQSVTGESPRSARARAASGCPCPKCQSDPSSPPESRARAAAQ